MKTTLQPFTESAINSIQFEIEILQDFYKSEESSKEKQKAEHHFLVVDDDYDLVTYIQDCLTCDFKNITVIAVGSGEAALKEIEHKIPDVLITDITMPRMDGFDLISRLRLIRNTNKVKILVITGKELSNSDSQKLKELRVSELLRKPFDSEKLKSVIDKIIENK